MASKTFFVEKYFKSLPDPRVNRTKLHELTDILFIVICATLCGIEGWEEMEDFAYQREEWLKKFVPLKNGIPSHDTLSRVFSRLDPIKFQSCFIRWVDGLRSKEGQIIAIDGKTVRGSADTVNKHSAIHMVSAWACTNQLVLGQVKVNAKSNEIVAIPELLDALFIEDSVITIDAMGCQKSIAEKIIDKKGDYLLAVKNNHKLLYDEIKDVFSDLSDTDETPYRYTVDVGKGHGRLEKRSCYVINSDLISKSIMWKNMKSVVMLESIRVIKDKVQTEKRFYITSLKSDAKHIAHVVRSHWGVENNLHWCLDVAFNEDKCVIRKDHSPENLSTVRRIILNILRHDKTRKTGLARKRRMAAMNIDYMEKVMCQYV